MTDFKPMLAGKAPDDLSTLRYPVIASPKLDGIRCVVHNGKALSRKLKPIPNDFVRTWIEKNLPEGLDGELMLQDHTRPFEEVASAIMSKDGQPDFVFMAFDHKTPLYGFRDRHRDVVKAAQDSFSVLGFRFAVVPHLLCRDEINLRLEMALHLEQGYEGTMVRDPNGPYKFGRSTTKEGYLLKIKQFEDEEAVVLGMVEEMENTNEAKTDALGNTKRSSAKAGKVGKNRLGALVCRFEDGTQFEVGSGFDDVARIALWERAPIGETVTIKHQPPPGGRKPGQAPRFPVFKGFRRD